MSDGRCLSSLSVVSGWDAAQYPYGRWRAHRLDSGHASLHQTSCRRPAGVVGRRHVGKGERCLLSDCVQAGSPCRPTRGWSTSFRLHPSEDCRSLGRLICFVDFAWSAMRRSDGQRVKLATMFFNRQFPSRALRRRAQVFTLLSSHMHACLGGWLPLAARPCGVARREIRGNTQTSSCWRVGGGARTSPSHTSTVADQLSVCDRCGAPRE